MRVTARENSTRFGMSSVALESLLICASSSMTRSPPSDNRTCTQRHEPPFIVTQTVFVRTSITGDNTYR